MPRYVAFLLAAGFAFVPAFAQRAPQEDFRGGYDGLRAEQKRLVDDWFARFSKTVGRPVNPSEGYENLPLSIKTTLNAVTHALLTTKLTDSSGQALAPSAIALIDKLDSVAGEIAGGRGDEQFRLYVQTKPGALDLLKRSAQFRRDIDNTVFHRGYPICFRSAGGVPSIQISLDREGVRADIDVDYRSSRFPVSLVNGHLTASNSDVRAGRNDVKHNGKWEGLTNWWRNLLGLPLETTGSDAATVGGQKVASVPASKLAQPADAVHDFLKSWLVDAEPFRSVAYVAEETHACVELEQASRSDRGMAKFAMARSLADLNKKIGKVNALADVSKPVEHRDDRLKPIAQSHSSEFALYDVREDLAEEFNCTNRLDPEQASPKARNSKAFGKYVAALFRIAPPGRKGEVVATLWQNQRGYWKLISYAVDPGVGRTGVPALSTAPSAAALETVAGDPAMIRAATEFLNAWWVGKNPNRALGYLAPSCLDCVDLFSDQAARSATPAARREILRRAIADTAKAAVAPRLSDAILAPAVHHPDLKLVKHAEDAAFTVVALPDSMGASADCARWKKDGFVQNDPAGAPTYGRYYATGFSRNAANASGTVLWLVWDKSGATWKAVSYLLMAP